MRFCSFSKAGRKSQNEDATFAACTSSRVLLAIADGMGGKEAGHEASRIAVEVLDKHKNNEGLDFSILFGHIQQELRAYADTHKIKQMGTTLSVCEILGGDMRIAHVGDSRIYQLRNNGIVALTKDQTELQKLLDEGVLNKRRAARYHRKNILLSAVTNYTEYNLEERSVGLQPGDRVVLLTDGIYELVTKSEMRDLSVEKDDLESFVEAVKSLTESKGIKDDYSVVAYQA